jgi:sec-independent protein translocase protein TatA
MSFGIKELIVILIIVMLVFGTKKIRNVGGDVGGWIKDFRKALKEGGESEESDETPKTADADRVIEGESTAAIDKEKV